ncbi:MAG: ABC transporter ATP-binding protein [Chloroflexi bacterium]|nr:ABC transporter ATP-binding protein [Chloroflexota bacterium]
MRHGGYGGGIARAGQESFDEELGKLYDNKVMLRLSHYMKPYRLLGFAGILTILMYTSAVVAIPWIIRTAIDKHIAVGDLNGLNRLVIAFALLLVVHFAANYLHQVILAYTGQRVLHDLRSELFSHLQDLSMGFHNKYPVGAIMSRVQNDVYQLQEFFFILIMSLADLLALFVIIGAMFIMAPMLAGLTLVTIPLLIIVIIIWQQYARKSFLRVRQAIARVNVGLQENISGIRVVQGLNRQDTNYDNFDNLNTEHLQANLQSSRISAGLMPVVEGFTAVALATTVMVGGQLALDGVLEIGVLIAFALYIQRIFDPIRQMTMQYTQLQKAMASGSRIFDMLDLKPEVQDKPDALPMPLIQGAVKFEGVEFAYTPGSPVLQNIDLTVEPGELVAFVGPTGAGKTTMVALLARFFDVTAGRITIDGADVRDVVRTSMAKQMGMVPQEPFLFSDTVSENIRYSHTEASAEEVEEAAKAVGAHEFIMGLKDGYDTVLGERGGNLSIGQRQLISFARALVADPRILVLDEATASIDTHTEQIIQGALQRLLIGRTAFVIAHRLSTIRNADKIVVMQQGQIVEIGTHDELLAKNGLYAQHHALHQGVSVDDVHDNGANDASYESPVGPQSPQQSSAG